MTITEFLLARIAEDEAAAEAKDADRESWGNPYAEGPTIEFEMRFDPARVLAECEAKRRIVEFHLIKHEREGYAGFACFTLKALAAVWVDHPDYREEWRP